MKQDRPRSADARRRAAAYRKGFRAGIEERRQLIVKIAEVASSVAFQAGEPAMEIAGQILSVLAADPALADRFMQEGSELILDRTIDARKGRLSYRSIHGQIVDPVAARSEDAGR